MAQQDAVIRLLLVEDQLEDAEHLISMLRNGGMAVRPQRPESLEDLDHLLATQSIDMVLARGNARYIPFAEAARRVEATGKTTMPTRWPRCPRICSTPGSCPITCTSSTAWPARPTSK